MGSLCICNGMIRSGSTWSFNVCRELYQEMAMRYSGSSQSCYLDCQPLEQFVNQRWSNESASWVIKAHNLGIAAMTAVRKGLAKGVCTFRDPRDCIASDLAFMHYPLEVSMKRVSATLDPLRMYQCVPHILLVRYESMMTNRQGEIRRIATHLGLMVDDMTVRRIDARTNLENSERVCSNMKHRPAGGLMQIADHLVDPTTHLHQNHINGGTVGRWRYELSEEQGAYVTEFFAPWLVQLGYETPQSLQQIINTPSYANGTGTPLPSVSPNANRIGSFTTGSASAGRFA